MSCKEKPETFKLTVKGKVVDYYTGDAIENAKIYVKVDGPIDPSKEQLHQLYDYYDTTSYIGRLTSNSSGNFESNFILEKGEYFVIVYDKKQISLKYDVYQDTIKYLDIRAKKFISLTIDFINKTRQYDTVSMIITSEGLNKISEGFYASSIQQLYEFYNNSDTVIVYKEAIPETNFYIEGILKKDANTYKHFNITKEIGILDTSKLTIEY